MDTTKYTVTFEEFKLFHGIDRSLYTILVKDLFRDPIESMQIMGLWLWLERGGFSNVVHKILTLPPFLINELADEAVSCLMCMNGHFALFPEPSEIPMTHSLVEKDISLQFFHENRFTASHKVHDLVTKVCIPAFSDIMDRARNGGFRPGPTWCLLRALSSSRDGSLAQFFFGLRLRAVNEASLQARTMFMTFSKGYPVDEEEVRQFFAGMFGNCLESFHMQEVAPGEQALYARMVFIRPSFINLILKGVNRAKFTINGKHVWMRKLVSRNARLLP